MKKKTLLLSLVVVCIVLFALPVSAAENFEKGFRGIPWGATLPKDSGDGNNKWELYDVGESLAEKRYERDNEKLSFAGAEVLFIEYHFLDSLGFAKVEITFQGIENYKLLRKACFENWGQPVYGYIDGEDQGPQKLQEAKASLGNLKYRRIEHSWRGKGIGIRLRHNNTGKNKGTMKVYLEDYYDRLEIDDAKYPKELEERDSFLESLGFK